MHDVCSRFFFTWFAVIGLAGCGSPGSVPEREVARVGDSAAVVLSTMGQPDEQRDATNSPGGQSIWIYKNYSPSHAPREQTGWKEVLSPSVQDQRDNEVQKPLLREVYRPQQSDDMLVIFENGAVRSLERRGHSTEPN